MRAAQQEGTFNSNPRLLWKVSQAVIWELVSALKIPGKIDTRTRNIIVHRVHYGHRCQYVHVGHLKSTDVVRTQDPNLRPS